MPWLPSLLSRARALSPLVFSSGQGGYHTANVLSEREQTVSVCRRKPMKKHGQILLARNKQSQTVANIPRAVQWMVPWQTVPLPETEAQLPCMLSTTTTDRPFLIADESGTDV